MLNVKFDSKSWMQRFANSFFKYGVLLQYPNLPKYKKKKVKQ